MMFLQVFDGAPDVGLIVPLARVSSAGPVEFLASGWSGLARDCVPAARAAADALRGRYGLASVDEPEDGGPLLLGLDSSRSGSSRLLMEVGFAVRPLRMRGMRVRSGRASEVCWALDGFLSRMDAGPRHAAAVRAV